MLALSASSKSCKVENVSLVWFPEAAILERNIRLGSGAPGDTVISDLASLHCDACEITYKSLGELASVLMLELIQEKHYKRYSKAEVKNALVNAYKDKRISEEKCVPSLLEEIKKAAQL